MFVVENKKKSIRSRIHHRLGLRKLWVVRMEPCMRVFLCRLMVLGFEIRGDISWNTIKTAFLLQISTRIVSMEAPTFRCSSGHMTRITHNWRYLGRRHIRGKDPVGSSPVWNVDVVTQGKIRFNDTWIGSAAKSLCFNVSSVRSVANERLIGSDTFVASTSTNSRSWRSIYLRTRLGLILIEFQLWKVDARTNNYWRARTLILTVDIYSISRKYLGCFFLRLVNLGVESIPSLHLCICIYHSNFRLNCVSSC